MFDSCDVISAYSRAQAIEDGVLIDVSAAAREVGFRMPVAVTAAVWEDCVAWSTTDIRNKRQACQDERGRLHDVVFMASRAAKMARRLETEITFQLARVPREGVGCAPTDVTLKAVCGPGDGGEPVITIMMTNED